MATDLAASFLFIHDGGWCGLGVGVYRGGLGILGAEGRMGLGGEVCGEIFPFRLEFTSVGKFLPEFSLCFLCLEERGEDICGGVLLLGGSPGLPRSRVAWRLRLGLGCPVSLPTGGARGRSRGKDRRKNRSASGRSNNTRRRWIII